MDLVPRLEFSHVSSYAAFSNGIAVPVALTAGGEVVDLLAFVDTGAANCLFERRHGELLNLDIETGQPRIFRTVTGSIEAFGHIVSMEVLGVRLESMVFFFADERIGKNLLGREGFLRAVRAATAPAGSVPWLPGSTCRQKKNPPSS